LYRLKLDCCQIDLKERWASLREIYLSRIEDHGYTFNDAHILVMLSSLNDSKSMETFFSSLKEYLGNSVYSISDHIGDENLSYLKKVNHDLASRIFNSICYFDQGEYSKVIELMYPIRYELIRIGGSNAQRDMFNQVLVQAALRSPNPKDKKLGVALLNERFSLKPNSKLNQRISERFLSENNAEYL
jgi:hypothetical protein